MAETTKLVMIDLDRHFIRGMLIAMLGAASGMKFSEMSPFLTDTKNSSPMKALVEKAELTGDLGGAKIAFIINTALHDLFQNTMGLDRGHSKILIEMIAGMIVNGSYHHNQNLREGPKRV